MSVNHNNCGKWLKDTTINPKTGRKIKVNGPTYKKIIEECKKKRTSPNSKINKINIVMVMGMGCKEEHVVSWTNYIKSYNKTPYVFCNMSTRHILTNIARTVCYLKPNIKGDFVQSVYTKVSELLDQNENVILIGHSYGGSIVTLVSELIKDHPRSLSHLQIATFGSIHTSSTTHGLNMKQYLLYNDVSLKCNKLKEPRTSAASSSFSSLVGPSFFDDKNTNITWINPETSIKGRWNIHKSYDHYISSVIKSGNIIL